SQSGSRPQRQSSFADYRTIPRLLASEAQPMLLQPFHKFDCLRLFPRLAILLHAVFLNEH
ncbi:MAG TPA: hypothetical protein VN952_04720, partial [Chthoniobacterales bacterium]|nr:hypothetical protein [Chthoniobacterales bacterium]